MMEKQKKRILVIDNDAVILRSFKQILQHEGYSVETAENGKDAIEKSFAGHYNLALVDVRLPDFDGTKLLTQLRQTTPKMRAIIVTGFPDITNAISAIKGAADDYVTKPANPDELLRVVRKHLQKQEEEREYSETKVAEYIQNRVKQLEVNDRET